MAGYSDQAPASNGNWKPAEPQRAQDSLFQVIQRLLFLFLGMTIVTPMLCLCAPILFTIGQISLGIGLAVVTWMIVQYPTDKAKERLASERIQPEMHLMLGTLLPELAGHLEKFLLWIDLGLRSWHCPASLRYPVLNFIAWGTGPLWFSLLIIALVFLLLVFTVISFGLILPFAIPLAGLLLGYSLLVPIWVISVYFFSSGPLLAASCWGIFHQTSEEWKAMRAEFRARRMIRSNADAFQCKQSGTSGLGQTAAGGAARGGFSPMSQRNPNSGGAWLSKQELVTLYVRHGFLEPEAQHGLGGISPAGGAGLSSPKSTS